MIGIGVNDGKKEWLAALQKDAPRWLQLYDADGRTFLAYNARFIPKYVLIDKQETLPISTHPGLPAKPN